MSSSLLIALGCALVALLVFIRWSKRVWMVASERVSRPKKLHRAKLIYLEQVFRADGPIPVIAKVDRGYRDEDGLICLVELKTRRANQPYLSDVIELSAQRFALEAQTRNRVADYGYVLIQQPGRRRKTPHRVRLLNREEIIALAKRREAILSGLVRADYACSPGLCRKCAFKSQCKPRAC